MDETDYNVQLLTGDTQSEPKHGLVCHPPPAPSSATNQRLAIVCVNQSELIINTYMYTCMNQPIRSQYLPAAPGTVVCSVVLRHWCREQPDWPRAHREDVQQCMICQPIRDQYLIITTNQSSVLPVCPGQGTCHSVALNHNVSQLHQLCLRHVQLTNHRLELFCVNQSKESSYLIVLQKKVCCQERNLLYDKLQLVSYNY